MMRKIGINWVNIMDKQKKITQGEFVSVGKNFENYIRESDFRLRTDESIVIHLDGVGFTHKYYKKFSENTKNRVVEILADAAKRICQDIKSIRVAYVCSDEVSFVLDGQEIKINDHNRLSKLVSKFASRLTLYFLKALININNDEIQELKENCIFSAKAYNLPSSKIEDYLKWRLMGCKKLIFDKRENFDKKANWEKYGYILIKQEDWCINSLDFSNKDIKRSPQNEYYQIK